MKAFAGGLSGGPNHTPTIFINSNEVLNADINVASLKAKIDAELAK
jgi:protein-disulfide isomerase